VIVKQPGSGTVSILVEHRPHGWIRQYHLLHQFVNVIDFSYFHWLQWLGNLVFWVALFLLIFAGATHAHRVRLITGNVDSNSLSNRHRRQIEIPFDTDTAFAILDASIRELSVAEEPKINREDLRIRARVKPIDPENENVSLWKKTYQKLGMAKFNHVIATGTSNNGTMSVNLLCEPEDAGWTDWFFMDEGTNLQNAEIIARAVSRKIAELFTREHQQDADNEIVRNDH